MKLLASLEQDNIFNSVQEDITEHLFEKKTVWISNRDEFGDNAKAEVLQQKGVGEVTPISARGK